MKAIYILIFFIFFSSIGFLYADCVSGDCQDGEGVYIDSDGVRYDGLWKDGKMHGSGTFTWADGATYKGEFENGKMNGKGIYTVPDGIKYTGEYKNGKRHGKGTITDSSTGKTYTGHWDEDEINGYGTMTYPDGSRYAGEWKNNRYHGHGILYNSAGIIEKKGRWENGEFTTEEGRYIGKVGSLNSANKEIIINIKDGHNLKIGEKLYVRIDGKVIVMEITFPMMTTSKCRLLKNYSNYIKQMETGMTVYKYEKNIQ